MPQTDGRSVCARSDFLMTLSSVRSQSNQFPFSVAYQIVALSLSHVVGVIIDISRQVCAWLKISLAFKKQRERLKCIYNFKTIDSFPVA